MYVASPSTVKFVKAYEPCIVITGKLTTDILRLENKFDEVIAIGGGAVMDAAKILSKHRLICNPTTASGSPTSAHSVVWDGYTKTSVQGNPADVVQVVDEYCEGLTGEALLNTRVDVWAHAIDTLYSEKATAKSKTLSDSILNRMKSPMTNVELVELGNLGGDLIRMVPTTLMHGCSYPLTGHYGIAHGRALSCMVQGICDVKGLNATDWFTKDELDSMSIHRLGVNINKSMILTEILKYDKIHEFNLGVEITPSVIAELFGM